MNPLICERFDIDGYPTLLLLVKDKVYVYEGNRSFDDL